MHHLPLATFEVENVGRTSIEAGTIRRADRLLHASPPHCPFLPGLDFVACNRKGTQLLELTRPDATGLVSVPPLVRIVPNDERARKFRQPLESRRVVAPGNRPRPSLDNPADLL